MTDALPGQRLDPATLADVLAARQRLREAIDPSPLVRAEMLGRTLGLDLHLKLESLLPVGSFKLRGAYNKIASLGPAARQRGVVAASAGNHSQGVALAAAWLGVDALVVVPDATPRAKVEGARRFGATVLEHGAIYDDAAAKARQLAGEQGRFFLHPFADTEVIAGQGTVGLELLEQLPGVETIIAPVGGGGLIVGLALAVKAENPGARIVGVEAAGCPGYYRCFREGCLVELERVETAAEGIAVKRPDPFMLAQMRGLVDELRIVPEASIRAAVREYLKHAHLLVELAAAVPLALLLTGYRPPGDKACLIVTGGNMDLSRLQGILAEASP